MTAVSDQQQLSSSGLAYLFASRFAPPAARGTISYATGTTVETEMLAINLPVVALWSLQEQGYLELRPYAEKRLRVLTSRGVRAVLLRTAELPGLEGRLLRVLAHDRNATSSGADVYRAMRAIVPESPNPFKVAIGLLTDDAVAAGYLTRAPRPAGLKARLTRPRWTIAPIPERYPELATRVETLTQAWHTFLVDPAYPALRDAVRRAIQSRKESDTGGSA